MAIYCRVVTRCDEALLFGPLKSGIPNLIWRTNRSSGSWVVTLNVPKELQARLPSRTGKQTKRLQTSTRYRIEEARRMGWMAWTWNDEYKEERRGMNY